MVAKPALITNEWEPGQPVYLYVLPSGFSAGTIIRERSYRINPCAKVYKFVDSFENPVQAKLALRRFGHYLAQWQNVDVAFRTKLPIILDLGDEFYYENGLFWLLTDMAEGQSTWVGVGNTGFPVACLSSTPPDKLNTFVAVQRAKKKNSPDWVQQTRTKNKDKAFEQSRRMRGKIL